MTRVQAELDETKIILHNTMESLLERGEKLDDLVSKSEVLGAQSKAFYKTVSAAPVPPAPGEGPWRAGGGFGAVRGAGGAPVVRDVGLGRELGCPNLAGGAPRPPPQTRPPLPCGIWGARVPGRGLQPLSRGRALGLCGQRGTGAGTAAPCGSGPRRRVPSPLARRGSRTRAVR
uniref:YKT6 v-SNARE homolog n=1 Tax=Anser brachyrhynchus TaxID=132585 RepID=A0A8B9CK60_9AVES